MKIKNVSVKVIGIIGHDLMPDESMECDENIVKNSAVDTLVKMGLLAIDDAEEKAKAIKEAALREAREQILKEQEEAAAKAAADATEKEADVVAADDAAEKEAADNADNAEIPASPKRTRRATKSAESAAE